jgi:hypothetical protein
MLPPKPGGFSYLASVPAALGNLFARSEATIRALGDHYGSQGDNLRRRF